MGSSGPCCYSGGIYGGIFTATEAAVVAVFYGFFVGLVVYRSLTLKVLYEIFRDAVLSSAVVMFIVAFAGLFSWTGSTLGVMDKTSATSSHCPQIHGDSPSHQYHALHRRDAHGCHIDLLRFLTHPHTYYGPLSMGSYLVWCGDDPQPCHRTDHATGGCQSLCDCKHCKSFARKDIKRRCSFRLYPGCCPCHNYCLSDTFNIPAISLRTEIR